MEKGETKQIFCYKFYDEKKRRLAIMGSKLDDTHVEITILKCSTKDSFSKKFAKLIFADERNLKLYKAHPQKIIIGFSSNQLTNWKKEFYYWCKENFFKLGYKRTYIETEQLERGNDRIHFKTRIKAGKI